MDEKLSADIPPARARLFREPFTGTRLSPESVERQSRVTLMAWNLLGGDAAIAFLNSFHTDLEGRPIDLAFASPIGCQAVESAISQRAGLE